MEPKAARVSGVSHAPQDRAVASRAGKQAAGAKILTEEPGIPAKPGLIQAKQGAAGIRGPAAEVQGARPRAPSPPSPLPPGAPVQGRPDALQAFRTLILSLGLPPGDLSGFLITSFKYFSLPMDPSSLAGIRKQLGRLSSSGPGETQAAAAASNKGVALSDKTLSEYAAAIDPTARDRPGGSGGEEGRQGGRGQQGQEAFGGQGLAEQGLAEQQGLSGGRKKLSASGGIPALSGAMAALAGDIDPRWALLNRLPGKDGKFWMVFPLNFSLDGVDFDISLRLLLENQRGLLPRVLRLAADIAAPGSRRLFVLDRPGAGGEALLYLDSPPSKTERARLERELGRALVPPAGKVRVLAAPPALFALDGEAGFPLPVDEEA